MDYRKPWSFRLGIVAFATVAFLAATGRSIGGDASSDRDGRPSAPAPVVLDAAVAARP
jgi:hypothetical protein